MLSLAAAVLSITGCSTNDTVDAVASMFEGDALISGLTSDLGIDTRQAAGGIGSILSFAESSLPAADYSTLAGLLPGADNYIKVAREAGLLTNPIADATQLSSAMGQLGIAPATATKLYSEVGNYLGNVGGPSAKSMLMNLL
jgi:hypothetical protein